MSLVLPSFNPTLTTSGTIPTNMGTNAGILLCTNHSGVNLILTFADGTQKKLWAQTARAFLIDPPINLLPWQQDTVLFVTGGSNRVDLELYGPDEELPDTLPIALTSPVLPATTAFRTTSSVTMTAATTWTTLPGLFSIGNYPFANNEITNGLATAGTIYLLTYAIAAYIVPGFADGTTFENALLEYRLAVFDSSMTTVVSTPIDGSNGAILSGYFSSRGGLENTIIPMDFSTPSVVGVTVAAGAGAPYYVGGQVQYFFTNPVHNPGGGATINYGVQAVPPPALT